MKIVEIAPISIRLSNIVESMRLSLKTFIKIYQNLFWALGYNTSAIPIAGGLLLPRSGLFRSPAVTGVLMDLGSYDSGDELLSVSFRA